MDEAVAAAAAAAFPGRDVDGVEDAGISWNEGNRTVALRFADGERAYLKVAVDGDPSRAATEAAAMRYAAAHTDATVPEVLGVDLDRERPYVATADADGDDDATATPAWEAWRDADHGGRETLAAALGRTLASLHEARFDGHGHVVGGGARGIERDAAPWSTVLLDTIAFTREQAGDGRFVDYFDDVVAVVERDRERLNEAPAALLHGDPARPNAFVREPTADGGPGDGPATDATVGLLDFELAHVGDPVRELQRGKRQFVASQFDPGTDAHVDAFYDGYRERAGGLPAGFDERYRLYDAVAYLGVAGFFETWADAVDEPTEELAAEVRSEMERRLDAARQQRIGG